MHLKIANAAAVVRNPGDMMIGALDCLVICLMIIIGRTNLLVTFPRTPCSISIKLMRNFWISLQTDLLWMDVVAEIC